MKGIKCFGQLLALFITVGLSLSVFSDANAITITQNAVPTGNKWSFSNSLYQYTDNNSASWTNGSTGYISLRITSPVNSRKFIHAIRPTTKINVKKDYYYQTTLGIFWAYSDGTNATNLEMVTSHMTSSDFDIISWTPSSCIRQDDYLDVYPTNTNINDLGQDPVVYACFDDIVLKAKHDGEVYFQLGSGSDMFLHAIIPFKASIQINEVVELNPTDPATEMNDKDNQDRQDIEQQSSSNEADANDAGDEADQTGQTLMQAFGSLITALTSVHETNCTLPNMSVYSLDLDNIDLCAVGLPSGIAALVGIGMCLIIVPLGIHLVKKMINLYKEIVG